MPNSTLAQRNAPRAPKLLDRVRESMRTGRYSPHTEAAYVDWIKRYIRFHGIRHPQEMGAEEVKAFLSHLATQMNVAASTQNQAFSALLFLYQEVLKKRLPLEIAAATHVRSAYARDGRYQMTSTSDRNKAR
jgi:site-specific recombinase XerD